MKKLFLALLALCAVLFAVQCSEKDNFQSAQLEEYLNLQTGSSITYILDSIVKIPLNDTGFVTHSYHAKDVIEGATTDNLDRPSWRVVRYLKDSASINEADWKPVDTYIITPTRESVEVTENNLRYLKLKLPVRDGFTWKGNSYIDSYSINSPVRFLYDWDYTYENTGSAFTPMNTPVENTITVTQRDEFLGVPNNPDSYGERTFSREVYGKGIGMIYKEFLHWIFQPRSPTYPHGYKEGYGIRLRMISHN